MAITQFKENETLAETLTCIICTKQISKAEAVAGLINADGQQQFACNGHFWNPHQFITGWADFMARERAKRTRSQFALEYGEVPDARTLR